MLSAQAVTAWQEILEHVERGTTPQQFATWFRNLQADAITETKVVLNVPSKFHRDWIATYYREVVEAAIREVLGGSRELHLEVATGETLAATGTNGADVVARPSSRGAPRVEPVRPAPRQAPPAAPVARAAPAVRTCAELPLTERYDFDRFVCGPSNLLAAAAGRSLAGALAADFSILLIVGPTGVGKTHLLQAIARAALDQGAGARQVGYVRGESFVNEFVTACATGAEAASRFRERWRLLDFVCFDDLHLLSGKSGTQNELVHTMNAWSDRGTRVVFGASCAAGDALSLDAALLARLSGAYRVSLRSPDRATRAAIVSAKAAARGDQVPQEVLDFLADLPTANVRELEGALTTVIAGAKLTNTPLSLRSARAAVHDDALSHRPSSSPERILKAVCQHFEVTTADLCSPRRPQALSFARQAAMYLLRERTELSLSEIGDALGGRDHTTILHGIRKIEEAGRGDGRVRDHLARVRQLIDR
jgi:chromosomal replication initiator protein